MFIQLVQRLISNYNASNTYAFTPAGPSVGALGLVSGMVSGTFIYGLPRGNGSCTSLASANFVIASHYKYGLGRGQ
jgi:membrane associated rhomboid family serine protease